MAWDFLSDPKNLKVITPDAMGFQILSGADRAMFSGQIIQYTVSPLPGYSTRWVTEITHVNEGSYFVDEQRFGPYALWHHKHFITKTAIFKYRENKLIELFGMVDHQPNELVLQTI